MLYLLIISCFGVSFGLLAYVLLNAFQSGAEVYSGTYSEETARQFEDIFLFIPPRRIAEAGWAFAIATFAIIFFSAGGLRTLLGTSLGLSLGLLAGALALRAPAQLLLYLRDRRRKKFNMQLIDALAHMSNALKAGFSIMQAFENVVQNGDNPIAQEFDVLLQQTRVGVGISEALERMDERVGSEDLTLVVMAIETARKTGGNLTEIFEKISFTIRERVRIENRIRTLTAQGRLQGIIVGAMPAVIGVAMAVVRPGLMMPFLHSPVGLSTIAAVVVLVAIGGFFIRKIIRIDV